MCVVHLLMRVRCGTWDFPALFSESRLIAVAADSFVCLTQVRAGKSHGWRDAGHEENSPASAQLLSRLVPGTPSPLFLPVFPEQRLPPRCPAVHSTAYFADLAFQVSEVRQGLMMQLLEQSPGWQRLG